MSMQGGMASGRAVEGSTRMLWILGSVAGCVVANVVSFAVALGATRALGAMGALGRAGADYSGYAVLIIAVPAILLMPELLVAIVVCCVSKTCPILRLALWLTAGLMTFDLGLLLAWKPK